nr:uncharacterized protein LOC111996361 [Quercus suber]
MGNPRKAGGGGLFCDFQGKWVKGYMRKIGMATTVVAEFWALRDGLILTSQMGINNIVVEFDAKVVIDLVCANNTPKRFYTPLLNVYKTLLTWFQGIRINHLYREENRCANKLAREGCCLNDDFVLLDNPLSNDLCILLNVDAAGMQSLRLIANSQPMLAS